MDIEEDSNYEYLLGTSVLVQIISIVQFGYLVKFLNEDKIPIGIMLGYSLGLIHKGQYKHDFVIGDFVKAEICGFQNFIHLTKPERVVNEEVNKKYPTIGTTFEVEIIDTIPVGSFGTKNESIIQSENMGYLAKNENNLFLISPKNIILEDKVISIGDIVRGKALNSQQYGYVFLSEVIKIV